MKGKGYLREIDIDYKTIYTNYCFLKMDSAA